MLSRIDLSIVLLLAMVAIIINYLYLSKKFEFNNNSDKCVSDEYVYYGLNFIALFLVFFAMLLLYKSPINLSVYGIIVAAEVFFWYSLDYVDDSYPDSCSESIICYINSSLVGFLYLLFVLLLYIKNDVLITNDIAIAFSTLLLFSIVKVLYGTYKCKNKKNFTQLHIYSYLFISLSVLLSTVYSITNVILSLLFNLIGYLLSLYSAKEISQLDNRKHYSNYVFIVVILIFVSMLVLIFYTLELYPLFSFLPILALSVRSLVTFKKSKYDEDTQNLYLIGIALFCIILYVILTWDSFVELLF